MKPDLTSPDTFVAGVPEDGFAWLRENEPISWYDRGNGDGFWTLTRYAHCVEAGRDWETFSSARGGALIEDAEGGAELMMVNMDPSAHTKLRSLVQHGFTPRVIRSLEPHIVELARDIVDNVARRGECDFVTDVAAELPLQVIAELIGIPIEDRHKIFEWSNRMIGIDDPEYGNSREGATEAAMEMWAYAQELADNRRREPADDVVTVLLNAEVDGQRLTEMDFNMFFLLLAVAGNETTRNLIAGGMHALISNPGEREKILADMDKTLPLAVEEMLRWVTPVMQFRRTVTRDIDFHGVEMKEGQKVLLWYISANRDEEVFDRPLEFDVSRSPNLHQTFGSGGPHFCLGASLARLEIEAIFRELLTRLPDMELAGPVERMRSNFINATKHMPVRFTPERV